RSTTTAGRSAPTVGCPVETVNCKHLVVRNPASLACVKLAVERARLYTGSFAYDLRLRALQPQSRPRGRRLCRPHGCRSAVADDFRSRQPGGGRRPRPAARSVPGRPGARGRALRRATGTDQVLVAPHAPTCTRPRLCTKTTKPASHKGRRRRIRPVSVPQPG